MNHAHRILYREYILSYRVLQERIMSFWLTRKLTVAYVALVTFRTFRTLWKTRKWLCGDPHPGYRGSKHRPLLSIIPPPPSLNNYVSPRSLGACFWRRPCFHCGRASGRGLRQLDMSAVRPSAYTAARWAMPVAYHQTPVFFLCVYYPGAPSM